MLCVSQEIDFFPFVPLLRRSSRLIRLRIYLLSFVLFILFTNWVYYLFVLFYDLTGFQNKRSH